jgi:ATP-dependent Lon protease
VAILLPGTKPLANVDDSSLRRMLLPLVAIREGVVFPHTEAVLTFGRSKSVAGVEAAFRSNRQIVFVTQKNSKVDEPQEMDFYRVGTLCTIERTLKTDREINALVRGVGRVKIDYLKVEDPYMLAEVTPLPEIQESSDEVQALVKHLTGEFHRAVNLGKSVEFLSFMKLMSGVEAAELADQVATALDINTDQKQQLLEQLNVRDRLEKIGDYLAHEIKVLELEHNIASKTQKKFDKNMRETVLRERMRTIKKELGEMDEEDKDIQELKDKIAKAGMPMEAAKKATKELARLGKMSPHNPEAGYIRGWLETMIEMPWSERTPNNVSVAAAGQVLNDDHYGLEEVKERILEYLAVMKLKGQQKQAAKDDADDSVVPTILCFVGPPGVGKTSIGRSIARALGRKFIRVSLGGIRDEAEIRGHRRTYVGAMPGRIIQGIKNVGTKNPVFMLDEIDKIGNDFRGDPSAALLEALDPEQNKEFSDHYLDAAFDLSEVMFITTANILDTIPPALRDRLEVIRFSGYTEEEKEQIAKKYLVKKMLNANAVSKDQLAISAATLKTLIKRYTREAGVRNLEREIAKIFRKVAKKIAEGKVKVAKITPRSLNKYLGPQRFSQTLAETRDEVGLVTGLAWTQAGGDIIFVEASVVPGTGKLTLTGQLGEVMKESAKAAISYVRSRWLQLELKADFYQHTDVHIHIPEGAVPKDGPSAGITMTTALVSALTKRPVKSNLAMTGEVTLRGRVLEIGGVKEKIIAASRAGIKAVILPKANKKDLVEVPLKVRKGISFHFVEHMDEVMQLALK